MKRTKVLRLVLLGGGVVAMVAGCGEQQPRQSDQTLRFACEQAKQQNLPNAAEICQRASTAQTSTSSSTGTSSSGSGYRTGGGGGWWFPWFFGRSYGNDGRSYTGSWFSGRSSSSPSTSAFDGSSASSSSTSSRGGFGATGSSSSGRSSGS
jgi:hypothetical protein